MYPKSEECIFVGYPKGIKWYTLLILVIENIFNERSINFEQYNLHAKNPTKNAQLVINDDVIDVSSTISYQNSDLNDVLYSYEDEAKNSDE